MDHIFPQSALRKVKVENPKTGRRDSFRYHDAVRNQLANCMLLSREENGAGGKSDTPPAVWSQDKDQAYLNKLLIPPVIPPDPAMWDLERFEDFVAARR